MEQGLGLRDQDLATKGMRGRNRVLQLAEVSRIEGTKCQGTTLQLAEKPNCAPVL